MYIVSVTTHFRAGHQLKFASMTEDYHIHDWIVEAALGGESLDENGLLFDFNKLKNIIEKIVSSFDGRKLEECPCFEKINASAENVAKYIYNSIKKQSPFIRLLYVEVTEAPGCKAKYGENILI